MSIFMISYWRWGITSHIFFLKLGKQLIEKVDDSFLIVPEFLYLLPFFAFFLLLMTSMNEQVLWLFCSCSTDVMKSPMRSSLNSSEFFWWSHKVLTRYRYHGQTLESEVKVDDHCCIICQKIFQRHSILGSNFYL